MTNQSIESVIKKFRETFPSIYLNYYGNHAEEKPICEDLGDFLLNKYNKR